MTQTLLEALQVVALLLVAGAATLVVAVPGRVRQVLALSFYGVLLSVLFLTVQAPDVTLSEMVVGAVALPLILLLTIAKVRVPAPAPGQGAPREATGKASGGKASGGKASGPGTGTGREPGPGREGNRP